MHSEYKYGINVVYPHLQTSPLTPHSTESTPESTQSMTTMSHENENNPPPPHLDPSTYPRTAHYPSENIFLELTYHALNPATLLSQTSSPSAGANVLFLGTTRDTFQTRRVARLSYTSYAPLALRTLTQIARAARETHAGLVAVSVAHRLGVVPVGEASIAIAVSAAHRGPAWRAGEEVLEMCKERLEVWKREEFVVEEGGEEEGEEGVWRANRDTDREGNFILKQS